MWLSIAMLKKLSVTVLTVCTLTACQSTPTPLTPRPDTWATPIKADANLHRVDEKLYRSEQLTTDDKANIEQLGIKTIINLRYFDRDDNDVLFVGGQVNLLNYPILTMRTKPSDIAKVLYTVRQEQPKGAVLVHCYHGADRTGIVMAMYRVVYQGWTIDDAKQEMQLGGYGYHSIWKNLDKLLSESGVAQVKAELAKLEQLDNTPMPVKL